MADRLREFIAEVKGAREERAAEQKTLISRLKAMKPDEFVRVSRDVIEELSERQYADVVRHIAPEHRLPQPSQATAQKSRHLSLRLLWNWIPAIARASVASLTAGFVILAATLMLGPATDWWGYLTLPVRAVDTSSWPHCPRLGPWTDGCTYTPTSNLTWEHAAGLLEMPEQELRNSNRHLAKDYIPAGSILAVWRHRGTLQGGNQ